MKSNCKDKNIWLKNTQELKKLFKDKSTNFLSKQNCLNNRQVSLKKNNRNSNLNKFYKITLITSNIIRNIIKFIKWMSIYWKIIEKLKQEEQFEIKEKQKQRKTKELKIIKTKQLLENHDFMNNQNYLFWKKKVYLSNFFFDYKYRFYRKYNRSIINKIDFTFNVVFLDKDYYYWYKNTVKHDNYFWFVLFLFFIWGLFYSYFTNNDSLFFVFWLFSWLFFWFVLFNLIIPLLFKKQSYYYIIRYKPDKIVIFKLNWIKNA